MPIQSPPWTDYMQCPVCTHEFAANQRVPITLGCGHSICKNCLTTLHRKQCPYDQTDISKNFENFPINYALLQLTTSNIDTLDRKISPNIAKTLTADELKCYKLALKYMEELALLLKPSGSGLLSRPMQRKLVTLIQCQLLEAEGRARSLRAIRSLGERTVTELILQHQNAHQLSTNLWAAVRSRGCQFLGPAMQEEVLKLVLLALEDGSPLSRKILVMYVVQKLEATFPQASKTSIGHVVQLLYRASCFKVSKRDGDSSLMTLKEEFRTYDALRREHDTQIVQIAVEAGLRIAPDQWSALLYGDSNHKSHMQSIIDKQQSPTAFAQSVDELMLALQRTGDPGNLARLRSDLENLSKIDPSMDLNVNTTWSECAEAFRAVREVVCGLVDFVQHHGKTKIQEFNNQHPTRYKVSFCRELQVRGNCARGQSCSFAHSQEELDRYRAKYKKNTMRNILQNNQLKETANNNNNSNNSAAPNPPHNGPIPKVNTNHHHYTPSKGAHPPLDSTRKPIPYRSENSLHHSSNTIHQPIPHANSQLHNHHLRPSSAYSNNSVSNASSSTPNLSQMQLSPNPAIPKLSPQINTRFTFSVPPRKVDQTHFMTANYPPPQHFNYQRPPLSAPPAGVYKKAQSAVSPYAMNNGNGYYHSQNQIAPTSPQIYRGNGMADKSNWYQGGHYKPPKNDQSLYDIGSPSIDVYFNQSCKITDDIDEVDGVWKFSTPVTTQDHQIIASSALYSNPLTPTKGFIRSDSLLATATNDEIFDSMAMSGKYGAIGGINKTPDLSQQWSGLQQVNRYDIAGPSAAYGGNVLKIADGKNGDSNSSNNSSYNGNGLSITPHSLTDSAITSTTSDDDYWSIKPSSSSNSSKDLDLSALGNGMSVYNLLEFINE